MQLELLAQAARDRRLNHGSVRLLAVILTGPTPRNNRWQAYADEMGIVDASQFRKQLIDGGYIPSPFAHAFTKKTHGSKNDNSQGCACDICEIQSAGQRLPAEHSA
jgi:hypothetical protein